MNKNTSFIIEYKLDIIKKIYCLIIIIYVTVL